MAQSTTGSTCKSLTLFGGNEGWNPKDWKEVSDSVRGGNSKCYLDCDKGTARFYGELDLKALDGEAGFASQQTTVDLDLSGYAGIQLEIAKGDKWRYTFIVKDDSPPPKAATGRDREQATLSWECDFELPPEDQPDDSCDKTVFIPWDAFNPTYRGKLQKDVDPLDTKKIKRFSLMMRSFFGTQEGEFSLSIDSIKALCKPPPPNDDATIVNLSTKAFDLRRLEAGSGVAERCPNYYFLRGDLGILSGTFKIHRNFANALVLFLICFSVGYYCFRD